MMFKCSKCEKNFSKESLKRNHEKHVHPLTNNQCTFQVNLVLKVRGGGL